MTEYDHRKGVVRHLQKRCCESCGTPMAVCVSLPDDEPCCGNCAHLVASFGFGGEQP